MEEREETFYRFGISENEDKNEIWYQILTPIRYFPQDLFSFNPDVFGDCAGLPPDFVCQYHPHVCPSLIPRRYLTSVYSGNPKTIKGYVKYRQWEGTITVTADFYNFLQVMAVK